MSYPLNIKSGVLIDDLLFNEPERAFMNTYTALKFHNTDLKLIKQAIHTSIWLL